MKTPSRPAEPDETLPWEAAMQRCVDGELSDVEERALLARLEFQPEGWRRLTLLFLENRLLGSACGDYLTEIAPRVVVEPVSRGVSRRWTRGARWLTVSLALLLSFLIGRSRPFSGPSAADQLAARREAPPLPVDPETHAPKRNPEPFEPEIARDRRRDGDAQRSEPVMFVSLEVPGSDQRLPVPIYAAPSDVDGWQPFEHTAISPREAEWLRRGGYQVNTARHLLQGTSPDGRAILVPVEAVNILPSRL
jgi:hypothetical protein